MTSHLHHIISKIVSSVGRESIDAGRPSNWLGAGDVRHGALVIGAPHFKVPPAQLVSASLRWRVVHHRHHLTRLCHTLRLKYVRVWIPLCEWLALCLTNFPIRRVVNEFVSWAGGAFGRRWWLWAVFWYRAISLRDDSSLTAGALAGHSNKFAHLGIIVLRTRNHLVSVDSASTIVGGLVRVVPSRRPIC